MAEKSNSSVYFRTVLSLALVTVLVFSVLSFVYFQRVSASIINTEKKNVMLTVRNMASGLDRIRVEENVDIGGVDLSFNEHNFIEANAMSQNCVVWLVDTNGRIEYSTALPKEVLSKLEQRGSFFHIPDDILLKIISSGEDKGYVATGSGFFSDPESVWVTAAIKLNLYGQFLIIHEPIDVDNQAFQMLSTALAMPLAISFVLALLLFMLMTRSIVRPIRLLSDVAGSVARGDLTRRIDINEAPGDSPFKVLISDEITNMVHTVNNMIEQLERQASDRRVFISSIAHDLRTPLTSINGFLTAIMDGTIPPDRCNHYMQIIKTEVERIQNLTNMMSEATSFGQSGQTRYEVFDINELIRETLTALEKQLYDKNLGVQVDLFEDEKGRLLASAERQAIMRVVYNLLANAIKFTPKDGNISISTYYESKTNLITVSVEDSGEGVPESHRTRIFDSFYKIDKSRTESGSGLGLYICKEILHAHNQDIYVQTGKEWGGAAFVFTISGAGKREQNAVKDKN